MIHDLPAARPPLVGQINCQYCHRRHSRRYACDDLLEAALQHDVRTGAWGTPTVPEEWQQESFDGLDGEPLP